MNENICIYITIPGKNGLFWDYETLNENNGFENLRLFFTYVTCVILPM